MSAINLDQPGVPAPALDATRCYSGAAVEDSLRRQDDLAHATLLGQLMRLANLR